MIKTIVVPTSGDETDSRVFATAFSIARPLGAHLKFFHIRLSSCEAAVRTPHVGFCAGAAINAAMHDVERQQTERSAAAAEHVRAFCDAHSIRLRSTPGLSAEVTAELIEETDHAEARLLAQARHSDLLVLGRPTRADLMPFNSIETLLLQGGRPIVIAPDCMPAPASGTVVVGWQETPAAARALSASLPLLKSASRVVLTSVSESSDRHPGSLEHVAEQLSWHGVLAETRYLEGPPKRSKRIFLQAAAELAPDLMVVAGYSHTPVYESFFGGVTVSLLAHAKTPIFMMH